MSSAVKFVRENIGQFTDFMFVIVYFYVCDSVFLQLLTDVSSIIINNKQWIPIILRPRAHAGQ